MTRTGLRTRPKRPIGDDWLKIEEIKGCPNILSSFVAIAKWRRSYRERGEKYPKKIYCVFCGRPHRNNRSHAAHLLHCQKRKMYYQTMDHGWRFDIGSKSFIIRSDCWGYVREAVNLERTLNEDITAGRISEDAAIRLFFVHVRGHVVSWHNSRTGIVSLPWDPSPAETGPGPATAAES